eukprot:15496696-Heterocapsa_arctica.AAC.1
MCQYSTGEGPIVFCRVLLEDMHVRLLFEHALPVPALSETGRLPDWLPGGLPAWLTALLTAWLPAPLPT